MQQIVLQVKDEHKAEMLRDLLASLDFVETISATEVPERMDHENGDATPIALDRHPQREQMEREVAAFEAMHEELKEQYLGQFVAIHQGQVMDSDSDEQLLLVRVRQNLSNDVVLFRKVEETLPPVLIFRSPRFVDD